MTAVKLAEIYIKRGLDSTDTMAERNVRYYMELYESGIKDLAEIVYELIHESEQESTKEKPHKPREAYDTLIGLASKLQRENISFPENLRLWDADVRDDILLDKTKKKRPRPTLRGPNTDTNLSRNDSFLTAHLELVGWGFSSTRCIEQDGTEYSGCCYEGGSALDVIGVAYTNLTHKSITYKALEMCLYPK